jgi:hypothetical protein
MDGLILEQCPKCNSMNNTTYATAFTYDFACHDCLYRTSALRTTGATISDAERLKFTKEEGK